MVTISFGGNDYKYDDTVRVDITENVNTGTKSLNVYYDGTDSSIINTIETMKSDLHDAGVPVTVSVTSEDGIDEKLEVLMSNYSIQMSSFTARSVYMTEQQ